MDSSDDNFSTSQHKSLRVQVSAYVTLPFELVNCHGGVQVDSGPSYPCDSGSGLASMTFRPARLYVGSEGH